MHHLDLTPSWTALLPAVIAVLRDGDENGRKLATRELERMATAADRLNAIAPNMLRALEFVAADSNTDMPAETALIIRAAIDTARGATA